MIAIDWSLLGLGAAAGAIAGVLFFAGLAWGMRLALRSGRPTPVLLLSSALRIAALLAVGTLVAGQGATALVGFAIAFVILRFGAIALARSPASKEAAPWN